MNDDALEQDLNRALRDLPRETASPGFTERVLSSLDPAPRPLWRRPLLLVPTAAALVAALLSWNLASQRQEQRRSRLAELSREQRLLAAELEAIRRQAKAAEVLYLGGDEDTDLVMDLSRLAARRSQLSPANYRPAPRPSDHSF